MSKVLLAYEDYSEMLTIQSVLNKVGFDVMTTSSEFSLSQQILSFNPEIIIGYGKGSKISTLGVGRRLKEMPRWTGKVILIFPAGMKADPADLARLRMDMALEAPLEVTRLLQVLANYTNQDSRALVERMMKAVAQEGQQRSVAVPPRPDEAVLVTGSREEVEAWNVQGSHEIEDFNRLMGVPTGVSTGESTTDSPEDVSQETKEPEIFLSSPLEPDERGEGPTMISDPQGAFPVDPPRLGSDSAEEGSPEGPLEDPEKLKVRVQAYEKHLQGLPPPSSESHRRTEVKKAQKDLTKSWSTDKLEAQDELRRRFASHLFKKKD